MSLLEVEGLETHFVDRDRENRVRVARALNGVSLSLARGEVLGLVGETGAGKSLTAYSILGLLKPPAVVVGGRAVFDGVDLLQSPKRELNSIRGRRIGLVIQSPRSSLDPLARVGQQLIRVQREHAEVAVEAARRNGLRMLESVGIADPERVAAAYPHELSGGMAQRVLLALALVNEPDLLIADEPTTGLDVTVQAQVLELLRALVASRGLATLLITHDLGVVANYCDKVAVMYAGRVVEHGPVDEVFASPAHPYTRELAASTPERLVLGNTARPVAVPPDLFDLPSGCLYQPRCPMRADRCRSDPPRRPAGLDRTVSCVRWGESATGVDR